MIPFLLFGSGCLTFDPLAKMPTSMDERLKSIEENTDLMFDNIDGLKAANKKAEEKFRKLMLEKEKLGKEYAQLKEEKAAIESLRESEKVENVQFKEELLKSRHSIQQLEQQLSKVQTENTVLSKEKEAQATLYESAKKELQTSRLKKVVKEKEKAAKKSSTQKKTASKTKKKRKIIKIRRKKPELNHANKLFKEARILYGNGRYEEAIGKWEEALKLEPTMYEALYSITLAKDMIKEMQEK